MLHQKPNRKTCVALWLQVAFLFGYSNLGIAQDTLSGLAFTSGDTTFCFSADVVVSPLDPDSFKVGGTAQVDIFSRTRMTLYAGFHGGGFSSGGSFTAGVSGDCSARTATWTGAESSAWDAPGNWSPVGIPGIMDTVLFNSSFTNQPLLDEDRSVAKLRVNGSNNLIDLGGYRLTVSNEVDLSNNSSIYNGSLVGIGLARVDIGNVNVGTDVYLTADFVDVDLSTFDGKVYVEKTGAEDNYCGGNVFNDSVTIKNSTTLEGYLGFGFGQPDTFNGVLTVINESDWEMFIGHNGEGNYFGNHVYVKCDGANGTDRSLIQFSAGGGSNYFADTLFLSGQSGQGFYLSNSNDGTSLMDSTGTIVITEEGFHSTVLNLLSFTKLGDAAMELTHIGSGTTVHISGSDIDGDVRSDSAYVELTSSVFRKDLRIPHTNQIDLCDVYGVAELMYNPITTYSGVYNKGNVFYDSLLVTNISADKLVYFGGDGNVSATLPDTCYGPAVFRTTGHALHIAHTSTNNYFASDVHMINEGTASVTFQTHSSADTCVSYIGGDLYVSATGGYIQAPSRGKLRIGDGSTLVIGDDGFEGSNGLLLRGLEFLGNGPDIVLDSVSIDAVIEFRDAVVRRTVRSSISAGNFKAIESEFYDPVDVISEKCNSIMSVYHDNVSFTKAGSANADMNGGNRFDGDFELTLTNSLGHCNWGYAEPDTFNGNVTLRNMTTASVLLQFGLDTTVYVGGDLYAYADSNDVRMGAFAGGVVDFNGDTDQHFYHDDSEENYTVYHMAVNKPSGKVTLDGQVSIGHTIWLTDGIVEIKEGADFELLNDAICIGGSDSSYFKGRLTKIGDDSFTFHVGDKGVYHPVSMTSPGSTSDAIEVWYERWNPNYSFGEDVEDTLVKYVTPKDYWNVAQLVGTSDMSWTIGWNEEDGYSRFDSSQVHVIGWNGSVWSDLGSSSPLGNESSGSVSTAGTVDLQTVSALAFGSTSDSILPQGLYRKNIVVDEVAATDTTLGSIDLAIAGGVEPVRVIFNGLTYPTLDEVNARFEDDANLAMLFIDSLPFDSVADQVTGRWITELPSGVYDVQVFDANNDTVKLSIPIYLGLSEADSVGLESSGSVLTKTAGDGWDSGYLRPYLILDSLASGEVSMTVESTDSLLAFGFTNADTLEISGLTDFELCFVIDSGEVDIWFLDSLIQLDLPVQTGDKLAVQRKDGIGVLYKNEVAVASVGEMEAKHLRPGAAVYEEGGTIKGLKSSGRGGEYGSWFRSWTGPTTCEENDGVITGLCAFADIYDFELYRSGVLQSDQPTFITIMNMVYGFRYEDLEAGVYQVKRISSSGSIYTYHFTVGATPTWQNTNAVSYTTQDISSSSSGVWDSYATTENFIPTSDDGWATFKLPGNPYELWPWYANDEIYAVGFSRYNQVITAADLEFGLVFIRPVSSINFYALIWDAGLYSWTPIAINGGSEIRFEKDRTTGDNVRFKMYKNGTLIHQSTEREDLNKYHLGFTSGSYGSSMNDIALSFGCSAEIDFTICEEDYDINWVETFGYTDDGEPIAHSKAYYDDFGKPIQTQTRMFADNDVIAAETVYDQFGRAVLSSLPAPINQTEICFKEDFITNESDEHYSYEDFNIPNYTASSSSLSVGEVDNPAPVGDNIANTLGWYYSNSNSSEPYVPASGFPYTRVEFDDRNPDRVRRSAMAGEKLEMGSGHEQVLNVVPIMDGELDFYLWVGTHYTDNYVTSLAYEGTKHISTDPNDVESLSYYDKSGNLLATCSDWRYSAPGWVSWSSHSDDVSAVMSISSNETLEDMQVFGSGYLKIQEVGSDSVIYDGLKSGVSTALFDTSQTYMFLSPNDFTLEYRKTSSTDTTEVSYQADRKSDAYLNGASFIDMHLPDSAVSSLEFGFPKQHLQVIDLKTGDSIYSGVAEDLPTLEGGVYRFIGDTVYTYNIPADSISSLTITCSEDFEIYYKDTLFYSGPTKTWDAGLPEQTEGFYYELRSSAPATVAAADDEENFFVIDIFLPIIDLFYWYRTRPYDCAYYYYDNTDNLIATAPPKALMPPLTWFPDLCSTYKYDSRGLAIENDHPDEGRSQFVYDKEGKLRFSQNALQYAEDAGGSYPETTMRFNYIEYDEDGRITETGEYDPEVSTETNSFFFESQHQVTASHASGNVSVHWEMTGLVDLDESGKLERSYILYDKPDSDFDTETGLTSYDQKYIMGRVSKTWNDNAATWYSYDGRGRLDWTVRKIENMDVGINDDGLFTMHYTYNAQGNVEKIEFNKDESTEIFTHWMTYDEDGRLTRVEAGRSESNGKEEIADYEYYLHGPLKRVELGNNLQGVDYVYTINGWLKSMNNPELGDRDPGGDDGTGGSAPEDIFGMTLDYFLDDYVRENTYVQSYDKGVPLTYPPPLDYKPKALYNGNIMAQRWQHAPVSGFEYDGDQLFYGYLYDKQNQLRSARLGRVTTIGNQNYDPLNPPGTTTGYIGPEPTMVDAYKVVIGDYDPNGNILSLQRNGNATTGLNMDNLTYNYADYYSNNQLTHVDDSHGVQYTTDMPDQSTGNYVYNEIGQMVYDASEGAKYYTYNASGLITGVYNDASHTEPVVTYTYDDAGQRLLKRAYDPNNSYVIHFDTWYVRNDAGQLISIYEETYSGGYANNDLAQEEVPLYASNRVGIWDVDGGSRLFELTDHLGNVRATFFDNSGLSVSTVQDYYPFGWGMPGRLSIGGFTYRFGYQGQFAEKDNETGLTNFELRSMDTRLGRWMIADPKRQYHSPYLAMGNNGVNRVDADGGDDTDYLDEGGNLLLSTNDGSNAVVTVYDDQLDGFWAAVNGSSIDALNDPGWNFQMKSYLIGEEWTQYMENTQSWFNTANARLNISKYWKTGNTDYWLSAAKEHTSTFRDPVSTAHAALGTIVTIRLIQQARFVANKINLGDAKYFGVASRRAAVNSADNLELLNGVAKGEWHKIYEAAIIDGAKTEVHYFFHPESGIYVGSKAVGSWNKYFNTRSNRITGY